MPFGCLALRDGRTYHSLSDITDKYEIGQVLKAKEFCELCLVKERLTEKVYVCKKFLKKDGKKVRKAAKNEIMILKMVNHPNILKLIDAFETRKEFYIIQELATGGDVFDWILDQGNYTERDAANVIRQVLEAVAYLHSLNIVHRNLKLENLMYYTENNHNKVVLRDFYLSRFENGSITEPCGTPEYLAPEVVARHRYGRPVDCWAIGVIMYMLLSGNPPFYDETEEENTDMHNRIIFCRIVAGDYEFDSPYWDDISPAAKELVCRLMEVDQMIRITAQDALFHEWIAGNGASEKNLKAGVCAQFEKNFAKAKWRKVPVSSECFKVLCGDDRPTVFKDRLPEWVKEGIAQAYLKKAIRVTTFMQRLRASDLGSTEVAKEGQRAVQADEKESEVIPTDSGGGSSVSMSNDMTVENTLTEDQEKDMEENSVSEMSKSLVQTDSSTQTQEEEQMKFAEKKASVAAVFSQEKTEAREPTCNINTSECQRNKFTAEATDKKLTPDTPNRRRMAANLSLDHGLGHGARTSSPGFEKEQTVANEEKTEAAGKQGKTPGTWCQTQLPETVAEGQIGAGTIGERSTGGKEKEGDNKDNSGRHAHSLYARIDSSSLGRKKTVFVQEQRDTSHSACRNTYCPSYPVSSGAAYSDLQGGDASADWQMDSVIEQIEKQMAAVLEKIEGDMPSLLEQIRDCPESLPRAKSAHSSPSVRHRSYQDRSTPPPLPTTPRPPMPSLPHLTIPPPSYPPPNPPTQTHNQLATEQGDRDGQRVDARLTQSPKGGIPGGDL